MRGQPVEVPENILAAFRESNLPTGTIPLASIKSVLKSIDPEAWNDEGIDNLFKSRFSSGPGLWDVDRAIPREVPYEGFLTCIFGSMAAQEALQQRGRILVEQGVASADEPLLELIDTDDPDEASTLKQYINFVASLPSLKVQQGRHLLAVARKGDCNAVPFNPAAASEYAQKHKKISSLAWPPQDTGRPDNETSVPVPWLVASVWSKDGYSEEDQEAIRSMQASTAKGPEELRAQLYDESLAGAWSLDFTAWPFKSDLNVIKNDICTEAQSQLLLQREQRGPPSAQHLERRRRALGHRVGTPMADGKRRPDPVNVKVFEPGPPMLEKEAALQAMQARWAADRAQVAASHDALAEAGAKYVAWLSEPAEGGRRWPPQPAAWTNWGRWFQRWRAKPQLPGPLERGGSAASVAESCASSWLAVSEISWVEVQAQAEASSWDEVVKSSKPAIEAAMATLFTIDKADVVEMKALAKPPAGVCLVMQGVCCLFGKKSSWKAAKNLLGDPRFLNKLHALVHYVPPVCLNRAAPFVGMDEFDPEVVRRASQACAGIATFVRAIFTYHALQAAAGEALEREERKPGVEAVRQALEASGRAFDDVSIMPLLDLLERSDAEHHVIRPVLACAQHLLCPGGGTDAESLREVVNKLCAGVPVWLTQVDAGESQRFTKQARACVERAKSLKRSKGLEFTAERLSQLEGRAGPVGLKLVTWVSAALAYYDLVSAKHIARLDADDAAQAQAAREEEMAQLRASPLNALDQRDVQELKALSKPPRGVDDAVLAVGFLIGHFALDAEDPPGWKQCQQLMANPAAFVERLKNFTASDVQKSNLERAKEYASHEDFTWDCMMKKSAAAAVVVLWVTRMIAICDADGK